MTSLCSASPGNSLQFDSSSALSAALLDRRLVTNSYYRARAAALVSFRSAVGLGGHLAERRHAAARRFRLRVRRCFAPWLSQQRLPAPDAWARIGDPAGRLRA